MLWIRNFQTVTSLTHETVMDLTGPLDIDDI